VRLLLSCWYLYICIYREHGCGRTDLPGTTQTGILISQMMLMMERTAWIFGNRTIGMTMTVHLRSLSFARYKQICDILKYKNKSICNSKGSFSFSFLKLKSVVTCLYEPVYMIYIFVTNPLYFNF
jgi:hypothetical protein